ncbi:MAG: NAD-dependent protein deacetylase [Clostridia bacterium]|nr:NAD-dependent protein deacetylase [Clostridia bacterium]
MNANDTEELYDALEKSGYTVVITGAGISIAAGGVTYSGMHAPGRSGAASLRSGDPSEMYPFFYSSFLKSMFEHGPTYAHRALAELESMGKVQGIITTNVDCMHTMAGSVNVAEIQGSFQINVCTGCQSVVRGYEIWRDGMPSCPKCGKTLLPYNIYSHAGLLHSDLRKAQQWMSKADLIIIVGATGCYTHMYWGYKKTGAKIVQINPGRTYFDGVADVNIKMESDPAFEDLMRRYKEDESGTV